MWRTDLINYSVHRMKVPSPTDHRDGAQRLAASSCLQGCGARHDFGIFGGSPRDSAVFLVFVGAEWSGVVPGTCYLEGVFASRTWVGFLPALWVGFRAPFKIGVLAQRKKSAPRAELAGFWVRRHSINIKTLYNPLRSPQITSPLRAKRRTAEKGSPKELCPA